MKSLIGSYGVFGLMAGLAAVLDTVATPSLYPSGAARAVSLAPTMPPPPGLLVTITLWPSALPSGSEMTRATMSVVPPGANGTCSSTGRFG